MWERKPYKLSATIPTHTHAVFHMAIPIVLASGSSIRTRLLARAGVDHSVSIPRIDEESVKASLIADAASPRDISDTLAEMKARKVSEKTPDAMVIGCDQVLDFKGTLLSKPVSVQDALEQLRALRGERHSLLSAAVICQDGQPVWRNVGIARLRMRDASDAYLTGYVDRNWNSIRHSVGGYKLEEEGVRLFSSVDGNYFNVLGMPLLELLNFLTLRGVIDR